MRIPSYRTGGQLRLALHSLRSPYRRGRNVVGFFGDGPPRLMFNGHTDHVPPAGMADPYGAQVVDGQLRGRGSLDMKAALSAAAFAVALLERPPRGSYVFTADVREEVDGPEGIQALLAGGLRADFGVSGEASSLDVALGHRGKVQLEITVAGRSSHAATPDAGLNAVTLAVPFLTALEREAERLPSDPLLGRATLTVTGISSAPAGRVAVVPSGCMIRIDRRYVRDETPEGCVAGIEELVARVAAEHGSQASVELLNVYPLMATAGTGAAVAGGLTPWQAMDALFELGGRDTVVGFDLVEVDPSRDPQGVTQRLANKLLLTFLAGFHGRPGSDTRRQ